MAKKKVLSAADILAANDLRKIAVDVPEWGGTVYLKEMSVQQHGLFSEYCMDNSGKSIVEYIAVLTIVDEDGNPLFTSDDISALSEKSAPALKRICEKAMEISGLKQSAEDIEKN